MAEHQQGEAGSGSRTAAQNKERVRRYTQQVWVEGDTRGVAELFAPDAVVHGLPPALPPTPEGVVQLVRMFWAGVPDMVCTDEDLVAEGDRVVQRFRVRGTHTGPLMGVPGSGRPVDVEGYNVSRFEDGRVVERWGMFDVAALQRQIGVVPGPPAQPAHAQPVASTS